MCTVATSVGGITELYRRKNTLPPLPKELREAWKLSLICEQSWTAASDPGEEGGPPQCPAWPPPPSAPSDVGFSVRVAGGSVSTPPPRKLPTVDVGHRGTAGRKRCCPRPRGVRVGARGKQKKAVTSVPVVEHYVSKSGLACRPYTLPPLPSLSFFVNGHWLSRTGRRPFTMIFRP